MTKKNLSVVLFFAALGICQASFPLFSGLLKAEWFEWFNFVTLPLAGIALFERPRHKSSWAAAISGGFFLDVYSQKFFGFWIIILTATVLFVKFILKKYVRIPSFW